MSDTFEPMRVLIVSGMTDEAALIRSQLMRPEYTPVVLLSGKEEAERLLDKCAFDLIVVNCPLSDEAGTEFAKECGRKSYAGVLLTADETLYNEIADDMEANGILALQKPLTGQMMRMGIRLVSAERVRLREAEKQNETIRAKMDEVQLINRAKWLLIEKLGMTEPAAHRFIEKQAMDLRQSRGEIARNLIRTYEN